MPPRLFYLVFFSINKTCTFLDIFFHSLLHVFLSFFLSHTFALFICFSLHEEFVIICWEPFQASNSVTRWLDYIFNAWPFTPMKICPTARKITKLGSKFCQILNEPSKNDPDTEFFAKSGHTARPQVAYSFWYLLLLCHENWKAGKTSTKCILRLLVHIFVYYCLRGYWRVD